MGFAVGGADGWAGSWLSRLWDTEREDAAKKAVARSEGQAGVATYL